MKKSTAIVATAATILALSACQIDPPGVIDERKHTPVSGGWERECKTKKGKQTCTSEWDEVPERCDVHVVLDDGGTMWRDFPCTEWDTYAPGTRYPKDTK
jgi:hypothetical protein